jgi:diphosphomevalonate decarboxylase
MWYFSGNWMYMTGYMMTQATAVAHSNLAFVKYWGKRDASLNIPLNNSISMNLSAARTTTTVRFDDSLSEDNVLLEGQAVAPKFAARVSRHLDLIRAVAGVQTHALIKTRNTFPASTGFASSASGFAALSLAASAALGLQPSERELSILARRGSGSACRSIPAGFAEWQAGTISEDSYATQLAPETHWELADVAVLVTSDEKSVSSTEGHELALNSPFWQTRAGLLPERLNKVRTAILERDFATFGQEIEAEALSMHAIMLTSAFEGDKAWHPGIFYWTPDTLRLLLAVQQWREQGLEVYFTLDAGPTVHLMCPAAAEAAITEAVYALNQADWTIIASKPAPGAHLIGEEVE